jgi:hypothetical protein
MSQLGRRRNNENRWKRDGLTTCALRGISRQIRDACKQRGAALSHNDVAHLLLKQGYRPHGIVWSYAMRGLADYADWLERRAS